MEKHSDAEESGHMEDPAGRDTPPLVPTGIAGLDYILHGGLQLGHMHLVEGEPGAGKTTLALQFLLEGVRRGERGLYVTLSETGTDLQATARSHGWSLEGVEVLEQHPTEETLAPDAQNTMFRPDEIELGEATKGVLAAVERVKPARVVLDSLSDIRHLSQTPLRFRRQVLALRAFFRGRKCTVLLLDDLTGGTDKQLQSLVRGVICLERRLPEYGRLRRRLQVPKMRGQSVRTGYHDFVIKRGGLTVFPRLVGTQHPPAANRDVMNGLPELDAILGGGLPCGTATLLMGAAGTGKSSLAAHYAAAAASRGHRVAFFVFDEGVATLLERSAALGQPLQEYAATGLIRIQHIDPTELSPGQFAHVVRECVEDGGVKLVVIDSLTGYLAAMPSEQYLTAQLHELLTYLEQKEVTTLLVVAQHGIVGGDVASPVDASYLADSIILLRYFEAAGEVRKSIAVVKKRNGPHELAIRELAFGPEGVRVGGPLREFRGVLTGYPTFTGQGGELMPSDAGNSLPGQTVQGASP